MLPAALRSSIAVSIAFHLLLLASLGDASSRHLTQSQLITQACPPANQCKFNVLAIGDSLTRGSIPSLNSEHPYSLKLEELLKQKFTNMAVPKVTTQGYDYMGVFQKAKDANGAILDITLLPLLTQQLQQATAQGTQYQWVIIMAGINDLGAGNRTAAAIMPKLIEAYQNVLKSGANVLAVLPFPNRFVTKDSKNEQERQKLVGLMQQYIASQPEPTNCSQPRIYLQQLPSTYFDFWSMPEARVHRMQDDKLHLTAYGYDMLGELLFGTISKHVPLKGCLCPVKTTAGGMRKQGTLSG